ncbi:MAG: hypothetical protein K2I92_08715 [Muribaculaceae bacterium]|nr:hypothetical protein [Muribaculaceae bacterium]
MRLRQEVEFRNSSEEFMRLAGVADVTTLTLEERYDFAVDEKILQDKLNQMRCAYQDGKANGWAEGYAEGYTEGWAKGWAKGWTQGWAKGWTKGYAKGTVKEKKDIARNMLARGVSIQMITSFTGLSEAEIELL